MMSLHSILVCGLDLPKATASPLKWEASPVPNTRVNKAMLQVTDLPIPLFRYVDAAEFPTGVVPVHLHKALNLPGGQSKFLFVHDASNPNIEESIWCMHRHIELLLRYGGRNFWVNIVNSPCDTDIRRLDSLAARFENELDQYKEDFGRRVLKLPIDQAYKVVLEGLLTSPKFLPGRVEPRSTPEPESDSDFWDAFIHGRIAPWRHKHYLRAAYLTMQQPENRDLSLLEVASKFARSMDSHKQRNSNFQLQPESRTLTVFWLYHVKLALDAIKVLRQKSKRSHFKQIFYYIPELEDEKFPTSYYSSDILKTEYAEKLWMLPDLRNLVEPPRDAEFRFREQITNKQQENPDRVLRFVFAVVQRYLRPGETRRRSWFINLAFASLQQQTMRLRTMHLAQSQFSVTQAYFYLQMVHAALAQLSTTGHSDLVQNMSYPLFKETFGMSPLSWKAYYSPQLWDSLQARAAFVLPDLRPLPDTIDPPNVNIEDYADRNEAFRRLGFIPELPSIEILHFHQAVLLEDAKSIPSPVAPSKVTSHAHLLKYIHTHLLLPFSAASATFLAQEHFTILTTSDNPSPLPTPHIAFYLSLTLHMLDPSHLHNIDYNPPVPSLPTRYDPASRVRFHSCLCHSHLPLPYTFGPNAVLYPRDEPYDHPPQLTHGCECHKGEELDHDAFATLCAKDWRWFEEGEKLRAGVRIPGGSTTSREEGDRKREWEGWVRGDWGLVLCWDRAWKIPSEGREGVFGGLGMEDSNVEVGGASDSEMGRVQDEESRAEGERHRGNTEERRGSDDERTVCCQDTESEAADIASEGRDDEWEVISEATLC